MTNPSDTKSDLRKELGEDTQHLGETLKGRARQEAETRKDTAVGIAGSASGALNTAADDLKNNPDAPEWMAKGMQSLARQIDRMASQMQGRSVDDLTRDATRLARQNPGTFLAASAAAGFAAARLLRAGADHKRHAEGGSMSSQQGMQQGSQAYGESAPVWPADENVMPTDTGTGTGAGFTPAYGAEGGTIR